ncbi:hypothetical protein QCN29_31885 [Streptomyces sp. HNM0663]|uniref:Resolvase/invertase-type recombinase catalytic domain-containing protein n=1 Tax=Streptomyces chengmaiensis TaxID=3040919 RepID=A0ABT6HYE6_9ACTN|nr:hypothetical protein [Streptomyces chengmaiensis]MDH2393288.1 hypothetical protein [Streptomyces chengmaiensis]
MWTHRSALLRYARDLGLPQPTVFLDNGRTSRQPLPELDRLNEYVSQGFIDVVLIPGPFVFALDDSESRAMVLHIQDTHCQVVEMPSPRLSRQAGGTDAGSV